MAATAGTALRLAARVLRVLAGLAGADAAAAVFVRFLLTSSTFSFSPSSDGRFLPRAVLVAPLLPALVVVVLGACLAGAALALRAAGGGAGFGARVGTGAEG